MAGVMMTNDSGRTITEQQVPSIDPSISATAPVVASAHLGDSNRAEGVMYSETFGTTGPDGSGYPAGTRMIDNTPGDDVN